MALWIYPSPWRLKHLLGSIPSQCSRTWLKKPSALRNTVRLQHQRGGKSSVGSWRREQGDAAVFTPPFALGEQQNGDEDGWICVHTSHRDGGSAAAWGTKERLWADISLYLHLGPTMSTFCCSLSLFSGLGLSSTQVSCYNGKWNHVLVPLICTGKDKTLCHLNV